MASSNTGIVPPSWASDTTSSTFRDASFSSYLNPSEENFIRTLVSSTKNLKTTNPFNRPKMEVDDEIDVFRADKYFNGEIDRESNIRTSIHPPVDTRNRAEKTITSLSKLNFQPRTPSVHSESSWNSQNLLLQPVLRKPSKTREKKSSFLSSCYCCDTKSVDIEDEDRFSNHGSQSFNGTSSYNSGSMTRTIKTSFDTADITRFNKHRIDNNSDEFTFPVSDPNGTHTDSDASSDLFELESLSCTTAVAHESRNNSDDYEPSEASVDWSVVTASAADFTAASDTDDQKSTLTSVTGAGMVGLESKKKSGRGGVFGGCRSQKAVRVAGGVYRTTSAGQRKSDDKCLKMQRFSDCYNPVTMFDVETKSAA